jgi:hypothetical protein
MNAIIRINELPAVFLNHESKIYTRKLDEFLILKCEASMVTYFALYSNSTYKCKFKISFSHIAVGSLFTETL